MNEERKRILQMVQDRTLSAEEAVTLLDAMGEPGAAPPSGVAIVPKSADRTSLRWFRIRVTDTASGRLKTSVRMPLSLLDFGLRIGGVAGFDVDEIRSAFVDADVSTILDVEDAEDGEHIEIFLE